MKTWIHRTKKSERDFYQTNELMVEALLSRIIPIRSLDPCCGSHAIAKVFKKKGREIVEYDLFPQDDRTYKKDFLEEKNAGELFETVIMNPPYSQKYLFLDHALKYFKNVWCLLPEISLNYNVMNEKYLSDKRYWGKIKMYPKMYLHEGTENKFGGTTCYSWIHFNELVNGDQKKEIFVDLLKLKGDDHDRI